MNNLPHPDSSDQSEERACNAQDDLLASLTELEAEISSRFNHINLDKAPEGMTEPLRSIILRARAAIASARSQEAG